MPVLSFTDRGIYCPAGDFYIDPQRPVPRALITHGHSDHARTGHGSYLCTTSAAPAIRHRLRVAPQTVDYGAVLQIGGARVSFHPAGHVPGSAQIRVEVAGEVWVVSGDFKIEPDGVSEPFEPLRCHAFISECTFGLPIFHWAPQSAVMAEINQWWVANRAAGRFSMMAAYSLGKAQRILAHLDRDIGPILTHESIEAMTDVLRQQGWRFPATVPVTPTTDLKSLAGGFVLAPPNAIAGAWMARFGAVEIANASGWMALRRRRGGGRGFVLSDHADWCGLNLAISQTGAERVFVTHGYTTEFRRWLQHKGYDAAVVEPDAGDQRALPPEVA